MPNTTNLSGGSSSTGVGIDSTITSSLGKQIQASVSRANLEARVKDNESIKGLYEDVQKMVSRWYTEDKLNIISTYGNANNLPKGANEAAINNETTLTLISNLDKEELKKIISSEEARGRQLIKDVYNTNEKTRINAKKRSLTRKNFESVTSNPQAKMASNDKQLNKFMKKNLKGTRVPKGLKNKFPTLRKELQAILEGYTNYELGQESLKVGIDFPEGIAPKELIFQIINKCVLYVNLIIGSSKNGVMIGSLGADEVSGIEDLIEMTSFSWVVGKPGLSTATIVAKRKKAMYAKKTMAAQKKMESISWAKYNKLIDKGKLKIGKNGDLKTSFWHLPKNKKKVQDYIDRMKKAGVLDKLSDDQLKALALRKGLPADDFDPETLKNQLYQIMATDQLELDKKDAKLGKIKAKYEKQAGMITTTENGVETTKYLKAGGMLARKSKRKLNAAKKAYEAEATASTAGIAGSMISTNPLIGETSDKIPVVNMNEAGNLVSSVIAQAVPVLVVGYSNGGQIQDRKAADNAMSDLDSMSSYNNIQHLLHEQQGEKESSDDYNRRMKSLFATDEAQRTATASTIGVAPKAISASGGSGDESGLAYTRTKKDLSDELKNIDIKQKEMYAAARARGGKIHSTDSDVARLNRYREESEKDGGMPIENVKKYVSTQALHILKKSKITYTDINPVFDINKTHEYSGYLETIRDYLGSIASFTSTFYTAFAGLQEGGLTVNGAAASGTLAKVLQTSQGLASLATNTITKMATGGTMSAANGVSHIVAGDSPSGKNNTELVSVNWANRQMKVTPVPKMATGGKVSAVSVSSVPKMATGGSVSDDSGVTNVSRMTSGERSKPLSVGISTGLVKYSKLISGADDDGSGTAIKVYSVNTGIDEKIKIGDSEASLFDLVYGLYTTMATVAQGITTGNQLLTAISANTSSTNGYAKTIASNSGSGSSNGFSFPSNLDSVLSGK